MKYKDLKFKSNFFWVWNEKTNSLYLCAATDNDPPNQLIWIKADGNAWGMATVTDNDKIMSTKVAIYIRDFITLFGDENCTSYHYLTSVNNALKKKMATLLALVTHKVKV